MGMHYSLVAVPAAMEDLARELTAVWPQYPIVARETLSSLDAWSDWKRGTERFVPAADWTPDNPGVEVHALLKDGVWAVLLDTGHVLATDADALSQLSHVFGRSLSFVIETASGFASFAAYRQGRLERSIESVEGQVTTQGEPMPEEAGLDLGQYDMAETEALQQRFGLNAFTSAPPSVVLGVAMTDSTDYSAQSQQMVAVPAVKKRAWWKLW